MPRDIEFKTPALNLTRRALLGVGLTAATAGCQTGPIGRSPKKTVVTDCGKDGGWCQYQSDARNSGKRAQPAPTVDAGVTNLDVSVTERDGGLVVDAKQQVFFGDGQQVKAIDSETEGELWSRQFDSLVSTTPILTCNAVIVQTSIGTYALRKTDGSTLWKVTRGNQFSEPVAKDGHVFVMSGHPTAIDITDGSELWTYEAADFQPWGCCIGEGTLVVAGLREGTNSEQPVGGVLMGLDTESGDRLWRTDLPRPIKTSPTYDDGTVYVPDRGNQLHAMNAKSGEIEWETEPYNQIPVSRRATTPTVTDGTVVVPSGNGKTTAGVDAATGEPQWKLDIGPTLAPALSAANKVLIGTMNQGLFVVETGGTVISHNSDTRVGSQMAFTTAGLFYKTAGMEIELAHVAR